MAVVINGTTGITSPGETVTGNLTVNQSTGGYLTTDGAAQTNIQLNTTTAGAKNWRITNEGNAGRLRFLGTDGTNTVFPMYFNPNGQVTMPTQPSFLAGSGSGDTTVASGAIIPLDSTGTSGFNVGSCYNTSTYLFTAPIAGKYIFNGIVYFTNSGGNTNTMQVAPFVNGAQVLVGGDAVLFASVRPQDLSVGVICMGGSVVLNLAANDTVGMYNRGATGRFYLGHTKLSGYLLG